MKIDKNNEILNDLGMTDWISHKPEESTRLIVNAISEHFLGDKDPYDFRPFIESNYVFDYFSEHGWEIDWFDILTREFVETVELNINSIAIQINEFEPTMDVSKLEKYVLSWVHEWHSAVKNRLTKEMQIKEASA